LIVLYCIHLGVLDTVSMWKSATVQTHVEARDNFRLQGSDVYRSQDPLRHCNVTKITQDKIYVCTTTQY